MIVSPAFSGKNYLVLGLARSGVATMEALLASGAQVSIWDRQEDTREAQASRAPVADPMICDLTRFDAIVASPGVPLNTHPIAGRAAQYGVPIIGDIELFAQARADLPPHKVVGITGTNGKSTTTALVHHILGSAGLPVTMAGNIGLPIMGQSPLQPNERGAGVYVLELSSYQIDLTRSLACEAAALLNITPDHLDRYDGFAEYAFAKGRLFAMQGTGQFAVFGHDDAPTRAIMAAEAERRPPGRVATLETAPLTELQEYWPSLAGPHNLQNTAAAVALVEELGVTRSFWEPALRSFRGLPHRMERIEQADGVLFVNDSKATNAASTAPALAAYPPHPGGGARIHWILGGLAKEDGLGECEPLLPNVAAAYTIGEAGPRFAELLDGRVQVERCEMMCEAVRRAIANAKAGDVIMLSPACASFDQFRDYEKRGEHFKQVVGALLEERGCPPSLEQRIGE